MKRPPSRPGHTRARRTSRTGAGAAVCLLALLSAGLLAPGSQAGTALDPVGPAAPSAVSIVPPEKPNIIVVMVDDLSYELMQYMPAVRDMLDEGTEFTNYFVSTSQCCPSRTTFLTGEYPHNTGVLTNSWKGEERGGFGAFKEEVGADLGVVLQDAGYRTGFIGKYLNEYRYGGSASGGNDPEPFYPENFVPKGWNEWYANGAAYGNFDYKLVKAVDPTQVAGPAAPPGWIANFPPVERGYEEEDYLTTVASGFATQFIQDASEVDALPNPGQLDPFALIVTPFATHEGHAPDDWDHIAYPPAPDDRPRQCPDGKDCTQPADWGLAEYTHGDCGAGGPSPSGGGCEDVEFPDPRWAGTYDSEGFQHVNPPDWLPDQPLSAGELAKAEAWHIQRIQMAQGVSDLIDDVRQKLRDLAIARDTYLFFTSDNGYYLGQHRLVGGKNTAYDHDVRVPLVVVPPGDPAPRKVDTIVQNTDFAPTLLDMALPGTVLPEADGRSFFTMIRHEDEPLNEPPPAGWRQGALLTYVRDKGTPRSDPDRVSAGIDPPTFYALRTKDYLYIDNNSKDDGPPRTHLNGEFYVLTGPTADPSQMNNRYDELKAERPGRLHDLYVLLDAYADCHQDPGQPAASCQEIAKTAPVINLD